MNTACAKDATNRCPERIFAEPFARNKGGQGLSIGHFLQPFARLLRPLRAKSSKDRSAENTAYIKKISLFSIFNQPFAPTPHARTFWRMRERGAQKAQKVSIDAAIGRGKESIMQPLCFNCRFFRSLNDETAQDLMKAPFDDCIQGLCRIKPPEVGRFRGEEEALSYDYGQWPLVLSGDWCGRHEPFIHARDNAAASAHVGPRSTISAEAEQPAKEAVGA